MDLKYDFALGVKSFVKGARIMIEVAVVWVLFHSPHVLAGVFWLALGVLLVAALPGCATLTADCSHPPYAWEAGHEEESCKSKATGRYSDVPCCESGPFGFIAREKPW